jgi:16S rRNA processing protein RimM
MISEASILFGTLKKTHGLKGDCILASVIDLEQNRIETELVFLEFNGQLVPFFISSITITDHHSCILSFEDITSTGKAQEWTGKRVFLPTTSIHRVGKKPNPVNSLKGYQVIDESLGLIGTVNEVLEKFNNPLIQVMSGQKEILIPYQPSIVLRIDKKTRTIYIKAPEGLIELF